MLVGSAVYVSPQTYLQMLCFYDGERFPDFRRLVEPAPNGIQRHPTESDCGHFNVSLFSGLLLVFAVCLT